MVACGRAYPEGGRCNSLAGRTNHLYRGRESVICVSSFRKLKIPVILIINKVDTVDERRDRQMPLTPTGKIYDFAEIIPVSALRGAEYRGYHSTVFSSICRTAPCSTMRIQLQTSRRDRSWRRSSAKRHFTPWMQEIPHGIAVAIDQYEGTPERSRMFDIDATIICERDSHKGIIIGKGGAHAEEESDQQARYGAGDGCWRQR